MAGKIIADTLEHSTAGSVTTDNVVNGSAKVWINVDQSSSNAIQKSFNTTSITDHGTGNMTVNYTNSFSDGNKVYFGSDEYYGIGEIFGSGTGGHLQRSRGNGAYSTLTDTGGTCSGAMGDLA